MVLDNSVKTLVDLNPLPVIVFDSFKGNILYANSAASDTYGYDSEEINNLDIREIHSCEFVDFIVDNSNTGFTNIFKENNCVHRAKNGNTIDVRVSFSRISNDNSLMVMRAKPLIDADKSQILLDTDRDEHYRRIVETSMEGIWVTGKRGSTYYINKRVSEMLGYSANEILEKNLHDLVDQAYHKNVDKYLNPEINAEKFHEDILFRKKDGKGFWSSVSAVRMRNDKKELDGLLMMVTDINTRKLSEDSLSEKSKQLQHVFDLSPVVLYSIQITKHDFIPNWISSNIKGILGYDPEEVTGTGWWYDKIHPDDVQETYNIRLSIFRKRFLTKEYRLRHKEGHYIWIHDEQRLVKNDAANKVEIIGSLSDITKFILAKKAAYEIEHKYRELAESLPQVIFETDIQGNITFVNHRGTEIFGYSRSEIIKGLNFKQLVLPERLAQAEQLFQSLLKGESLHNHEYAAKKSDGTEFPVIMNADPITSGEEITGIRGIIIDVSQLKTVEKELRANFNMLDGLIKASPISIIVMSPELKTILWNKSAEKMFGWKAHEVIGKELPVIPESSSEEKLVNTKKVLSGESVLNVERKRLRKDGSLIDVKFSAVPVYDGDHNITGLLALYEDITERKKIEAELQRYKVHLEETVKQRTESLSSLNIELQEEIKKRKESETEIQDQYNFMITLFETIPNPIYIKSTDKVFLNCNKACEDYFHMPKDQIVGRTIYNIVPKELADRLDRKDEELLKNPGRQNFELHFTDHDGREQYLLVDKATYNKADGSIGGIIAVMVEITEIKKLQDQFKSSLQKEKDLNELKSRFISTASHEFRTPLTTILSSADIMEIVLNKNQDSLQKEKKISKHINKIQNAVHSMTDLLNDVLTINRTETGKMQLEPAQINLPALCKSILEELSPLAKNGQKIQYTYKAEDKTFMLDPKLLKLILANILSNALKYSPAGTNVIFEVDKTDGHIIFNVKDEGIGIPEKDQPKLFEPFYRGENSSNEPGTGLGLSIVRRSVELHNGEITFSSKEGEGSFFTVTIKAANN